MRISHSLFQNALFALLSLFLLVGPTFGEDPPTQSTTSESTQQISESEASSEASQQSSEETQPSEDEAPVCSVSIYALDYENQPVSNLQIEFELAGSAPQNAQTNVDGEVEIEGTTLGQFLKTRIQDEIWYSYENILEGECGGPPVVFRVFPRNPDPAMSAKERQTFHQAKVKAMIEALEHAGRRHAYNPSSSASKIASSAAFSQSSPDAKKTTAPQKPTLFSPAHDPVWGASINRPIVAFVEGLRNEDAGGIIVAETLPTTRSASVFVRLIDGRGKPIADEMIDLLILGDEPNYMVSLAGRERSDRRGRAVFHGVRPGAWYRAEASADGVGAGRSTVFTVVEKQTKRLRPIVLRPRDRVVSGFVLRENGPASNARIRARDKAGSKRSALTTLADSQGYFVLGPIPTESCDLEITHAISNKAKSVTIAFSPESDILEQVIPLDSLIVKSTTAPQK